MYQLSIDDYLEEVREIPLSQGKVALVSACDYDWLMQWKWGEDHNGYAYRKYRVKGRQCTAQMHRLIMSASAEIEVDHRNGCHLDNRRSNLRLATSSQNKMNTRKRTGTSSIYKGVTFHKSTGKWQARIRLDNRSMYLGLFVLEADAARTYDTAAKNLFGEFARTNF